jgi:hypothetical protein
MADTIKAGRISGVGLVAELIDSGNSLLIKSLASWSSLVKDKLFIVTPVAIVVYILWGQCIATNLYGVTVLAFLQEQTYPACSDSPLLESLLSRAPIGHDA